MTYYSLIYADRYLNGTNFRVDRCSRFSRILLKFEKLNHREIFDNRRFAKINPRENFGNGKLAKINLRDDFSKKIFSSFHFSSLHFSSDKYNTNVYYEIVKMFQVDRKMYTGVSEKYTNLGESLNRDMVTGVTSASSPSSLFLRVF